MGEKKQTTFSGCHPLACRCGGMGRRLLSPHPAARVGENSPTLTRATSLKAPPPGVTVFPPGWQVERLKHLQRICLCLQRGRAAGKGLRGMLVKHAWRWRNRRYACDPTRKIRFSLPTLTCLFYRWDRSAGDPAVLAVHYRAPVKIRRAHVLDFARICLDSPARSFAEAYGRLPRPRATVFAYRLALGERLLRQVVKVFATRRAADWRLRRARAELTEFRKRGTP